MWHKVLQRVENTVEKEKLLVMSNFSFSLSVFQRLLLQTHRNPGLVRERIMANRCKRNYLKLLSFWVSRTHPILSYPETVKTAQKIHWHYLVLYLINSFESKYQNCGLDLPMSKNSEINNKKPKF